MSRDTPSFDVFGCALQHTQLIEASAGTDKQAAAAADGLRKG